MERQIEQDVRQDIGGDEQRIDGVRTLTSNETFQHLLLLAVWIGAYRLHEESFSLVVNARTGEAQGERPYSAIKITLLVFGIIFLILILWVMGQR